MEIIAKAPTAGAIYDVPYPPSWYDRLTDWVEELPIPWWSFYILLALGLSGTVALGLWLGGVYASVGFHRMQVWFPLLIAYLLGLSHGLDRLAGSAIERYRPAFRGNGAEFATAAYRMTHLPARTALISTIVATIFFVPASYLEFSVSQTGGLDLVPGLFLALMVLNSIAGWIFLYHAYHQLREIHRLYRDQTDVRLTRIRPLYAFSRVTAVAAVGSVINVYGWYLAQPGQDIANPVGLGEGVFNLVFVLIVFAWPLWGAHRLLAEKKEEALMGAAHRKEAVLAKLHRELDGDQLDGIQQLNHALVALNTEVTDLSKVSTWPWAPGTLHGLVGAVLLPIGLWLIQRLLGGLLG